MVIDYTGGKFEMDKLILDDCLELRSGRKRVLRYPSTLPSYSLDRGDDDEDGAPRDKKEGASDVLAVRYRLGSDIRTLYFHAAIR